MGKMENRMKSDKKYNILGIVLLAIVIVGALWVIVRMGNFSVAGGEAEEGSTTQGNEDSTRENSRENNDTVELPVFCVDAMEAVEMKDDFAIEDYYYTSYATVENQYFIDENQVLWGYGRNEYGQLGIGQVDDIETVYTEPVKIAESVVSVDSSCNNYFTIYLTDDGKLYGMGSNRLGLLGQPYVTCYSDSDYVKVPEPVLLMENVAYASAGMKSIAALKKDGSVWWWGEYSSTYLTNADFDISSKAWQSEEDEKNPAKMLYNHPRKVLENCIYAVTGNWNGAAITSDGELYTWGLNIFGECGLEIKGDDYVRTPAKALDDVNMIWIEKIEDGRMEHEDLDVTKENTLYSFNLFAQLRDGTMLAAGKDLDGKKKAIELTGDIVSPSIETYSDTFVPIALEEYSEAKCREKLNKLEWGMTVLEAEQLLSQERLEYAEVLWPVEGTQNELSIRELEIEDGNYWLSFDEEKRLYEIRLQIGGSRNGQFSMGMTLQEVRDLLDCDLLLEQKEDSDNHVYWTKELVEGSYLGFIFGNETEEALIFVIETDSLEHVLDTDLLGGSK